MHYAHSERHVHSLGSSPCAPNCAVARWAEQSLAVRARRSSTKPIVSDLCIKPREACDLESNRHSLKEHGSDTSSRKNGSRGSGHLRSLSSEVSNRAARIDSAFLTASSLSVVVESALSADSLAEPAAPVAAVDRELAASVRDPAAPVAAVEASPAAPVAAVEASSAREEAVPAASSAAEERDSAASDAELAAPEASEAAEEAALPSSSSLEPPAPPAPPRVVVATAVVRVSPSEVMVLRMVETEPLLSPEPPAPPAPPELSSPVAYMGINNLVFVKHKLRLLTVGAGTSPLVVAILTPAPNER